LLGFLTYINILLKFTVLLFQGKREEDTCNVTNFFHMFHQYSSMVSLDPYIWRVTLKHVWICLFMLIWKQRFIC